jgi:hypothetical protein
MKTILTIIFILIAGAAGATSLVCDCIVGADYYVITGLPATYNASHVPADPTGQYGFRLDISAIPVGTYAVRYQPCTTLWGCSVPSAEFKFTRPALLQADGACKVIP